MLEEEVKSIGPNVRRTHLNLEPRLNTCLGGKSRAWTHSEGILDAWLKFEKVLAKC